MRQAEDHFETGLINLRSDRKDNIMLYTIAVVMIVLWLLGLISSYTMGGFIHILLVIAIVVVLLRVIKR
jgi:t-SNARE complex subunit (syntaxin)